MANEEAATASDGLEQMGVEELRQLARDLDVPGRSTMRKEELVAAIRERRASGGERADGGRRRRPAWAIPVGILAAAVLLVVVLVLALRGGGDDLAAAGVGESLTAGVTTYTLDAVTTARALGPAQAEGVFVLADVTLTVEGDVTAFDHPAARVVDGDGAARPPEPDNAVPLGDLALTSQPISRGEPASGRLVFDVPADAVEGSELVLRDLAGTDEVSFDLGLTEASATPG
jgi:hypothetical protein